MSDQGSRPRLPIKPPGERPYATAELHRAEAERHFGMAKAYKEQYENGLRLPEARIDVNPIAHDAFVTTPKRLFDTNYRLGKEASDAMGLEVARVTIEIFGWHLLRLGPVVTIPDVIASLEELVASTDEPMLAEYGPVILSTFPSALAYLGSDPVPLTFVWEQMQVP